MGPALRFLREAGFQPAPAPRGARAFDGTLDCRLGPVPIRLQVRDWDFLVYPTIRLLERPAFLPPATPHVFGSNGLCYFQTGAVILDRYNPDRALAQCLAQARVVIDELSTNSQFRQSEFETDFEAVWSIGQDPHPYEVLLGQVAAGEERATLRVLDDKRYVLVTTQPGEAEALCEVRGWPKPTDGAPCWLLETRFTPTQPADGFPTTVGAMFAWLRSWSRDAHKRLQAILGSCDYLQATTVVFLIHSPVGRFGFALELDAIKRKACAHRPTSYRQYLHGTGRNTKIIRLAVSEFGQEFVHGRNIEGDMLKDRRIALIGAGAVGGYLATALARLGAGTGERGRLTIIDGDRLGPGNLGRHVLGFDYLMENKAQALRLQLLRQFPYLSVVAQPRDTNLISDLRADLVIDATGEEVLSEALNHRHQRMTGKDRPPFLHAWVAGNGECVQALWVDSRKFACYHCLRQLDAQRTPRFEPVKTARRIRRIGCHALTPYAVSAPMAAAALATDLVIGWLRGEVSPRFRTRVVEGQDLRVTRNQNPSPLDGCPACTRIN